MDKWHFMRTYLLSYAFLVTMFLRDYRRSMEKIIIMYNDIVNRNYCMFICIFNNCLICDAV